MNNNFITIRQATELTGKADKIRAYKIGKELRIDKEEFNKFLNKVKTK